METVLNDLKRVVGLVEINENNSLWFTEWQDHHMPIAVSHGEGRAEFASDEQINALQQQGQVIAQYR